MVVFLKLIMDLSGSNETPRYLTLLAHRFAEEGNFRGESRVASNVGVTLFTVHVECPFKKKSLSLTATLCSHFVTY